MRHRRKPLVAQSPDGHGALPRKFPVKDGIRDALPVVHSALFLALSSDGFHIDNMPELAWEHRCLTDFHAEEWLASIPKNGRFPCRNSASGHADVPRSRLMGSAVTATGHRRLRLRRLDHGFRIAFPMAPKPFAARRAMEDTAPRRASPETLIRETRDVAHGAQSPSFVRCTRMQPYDSR